MDSKTLPTEMEQHADENQDTQYALTDVNSLALLPWAMALRTVSKQC